SIDYMGGKAKLISLMEISTKDNEQGREGPNGPAPTQSRQDSSPPCGLDLWTRRGRRGRRGHHLTVCWGIVSIQTPSPCRTISTANGDVRPGRAGPRPSCHSDYTGYVWPEGDTGFAILGDDAAWRQFYTVLPLGRYPELHRYPINWLPLAICHVGNELRVLILRDLIRCLQRHVKLSCHSDWHQAWSP